MRIDRQPRRLFALLGALALAACGDTKATPPSSPAPGAAAAEVAQPATLDGLVAQVHALRKSGDSDGAFALVLTLLPTQGQLKSILKAGPDTDAFLGKYPLHDLRADDARVIDFGKQLFKPANDKQTEIQVYAATTEELAAYAKGTPAFEFPGGAQRFAEAIAAPGRTWYYVRLAVPGEGHGMTYSLFTRLDDRFLFLAKPWQGIPRAK